MSKRQVIRVDEGPRVEGYLSAAIRAGDFVFVSGNIAMVPAGTAPAETSSSTRDVRDEARQALENLKATLTAAGATLDDVVKVNVFLRDPDRDFEAFNTVYVQYFPHDPPARTCVGATIDGGWLVEVECTAYSPAGRKASPAE